MKHTMVKKTLTALTIILLSQPLFSTNISPDNRFMSDNEESVTIDAWTSLSQIKDYGRGFICHEYEIEEVMFSRTKQPLLT
jgi:hypothetical protein